MHVSFVWQKQKQTQQIRRVQLSLKIKREKYTVVYVIIYTHTHTHHMWQLNTCICSRIYSYQQLKPTASICVTLTLASRSPIRRRCWYRVGGQRSSNSCSINVLRARSQACVLVCFAFYCRSLWFLHYFVLVIAFVVVMREIFHNTVHPLSGAFDARRLWEITHFVWIIIIDFAIMVRFNVTLISCLCVWLLSNGYTLDQSKSIERFFRFSHKKKPKKLLCRWATHVAGSLVA